MIKNQTCRISVRRACDQAVQGESPRPVFNGAKIQISLIFPYNTSNHQVVCVRILGTHNYIKAQNSRPVRVQLSSTIWLSWLFYIEKKISNICFSVYFNLIYHVIKAIHTLIFWKNIKNYFLKMSKSCLSVLTISRQAQWTFWCSSYCRDVCTNTGGGKFLPFNKIHFVSFFKCSFIFIKMLFIHLRESAHTHK